MVSDVYILLDRLSFEKIKSKIGKVYIAMLICQRMLKDMGCGVWGAQPDNLTSFGVFATAYLSDSNATESKTMRLRKN
jgi:hypothetical protein